MISKALRNSLDRNMITLVNTLHTFVTTHGSCGGHRQFKGNCEQPYGHFFVSIRGKPEHLRLLRTFAHRYHLTFCIAPKNKSPLCGKCETHHQPRWYALRGRRDPQQVARDLKHFLKERRNVL